MSNSKSCVSNFGKSNIIFRSLENLQANDLYNSNLCNSKFFDSCFLESENFHDSPESSSFTALIVSPIRRTTHKGEIRKLFPFRNVIMLIV